MIDDLQPIQPAWLDAHRPREGRYVLGPFLGKGGMGEVVEAWDTVLCRTVALKILRNMEPTALIRFMHEAQIQARMVHPRICRIYDVDSSEGTVKIAMQLVRGPNLEVAARELARETVVSLVAQAAEAIHAAHNLKLIHRDLKPSNILLEKDGTGNWTPYICDFGLAMALDEPAMTATNGVIGTPAFMAPEQYRGERSLIGPATDVYGLGGTLHFALMGRAYEAPTQSSGARVTPAGATRSGEKLLPADLWTIIEKCLESDPALRYPTAAALAEDLWRHLNGERVQAAPEGRLARLWRRSHQGLRRALVAALVVAALGVGWRVEGAFLRADQERRLAVLRRLAVESAELEQGLGFEAMLAPHDVRVARGKARARLAAMQDRIRSLGKAAGGSGNWALARVWLALGDNRQAEAEVAQAWQEGFRGPGLAALWAEALGRAQLDRAFGPETGGTPDDAALAARVAALAEQGRDQDLARDDYVRGLEAFLRKEYAAAVEAAGAGRQLRPWDGPTACLEILGRAGLGQARLEAGDLAGAEGQFAEGARAAQASLAVLPSDPALRHASLVLALGADGLRLDQGRLQLADLAELQAQCDLALRLDPDDPRLQADWLDLRCLRAMLLSDQGQDPSRDLDAALVFLGTRLREPVPAGLRAARMGIYWRMAERRFELGEDPGPALAEAVKDLGEAPPGRRDWTAPLLNFKARVEALARLEPALAAQPSWRVLESAAEAWLIRAEWEAAHGVEPSPSITRATSLSENAAQACPAARSAQFLNGLSWAMAMKLTPGRAPMLHSLAEARLRSALALKPRGARLALLQSALRTGAPARP